MSKLVVLSKKHLDGGNAPSVPYPFAKIIYSCSDPPSNRTSHELESVLPFKQNLS